MLASATLIVGQVDRPLPKMPVEGGRVLVPTLIEEQSLWQQGYQHVVGVDEVGRGCLAGPVVAAAVVFPSTLKLYSAEDTTSSAVLSRWLRDSKKLSAGRRTEVAAEVKRVAVGWSLGVVAAEEIDQMGIELAVFEAMERAVRSLTVTVERYLIDGRPHPVWPRHLQLARPRADATITSVAAASVVAKVYRDDLMDKLAVEYPVYGFERHKGYGTVQHRVALSQHGACLEHRKSFSWSSRA